MSPFPWLARRLSAPTRPITRSTPRPIALRCEQMEDRTVPTATVSIVAISNGTTAGTPAAFEVDRTGDTGADLTVDLLVSGSADFYTTSQILIPAGYSSAELDIAPVVGGAAGTVDVTLEDDPGVYDIASPGGTAELYISDSTAATFTLNGSDGSIRFDLPWDSVDPSQASQSLALANFAITVGYGMGSQATLTPSNATFTTSPTAEFENGVLTGITFAIDTSAIPGFDYSSISATGLTLSAVLTGTSTTVSTTVELRNSVKLDFAGVTTGKAYDAEVYLKTDKEEISFFYSVGASETPGGLRDALANEIEKRGFTVVKSGTTGLIIEGKGKDELQEVRITFGKPNDTENGHEKPDTTLKGPKLVGVSGGANAWYNGDALSLND